MRKRGISLNELRRRLKSTQLVRVRTKMSVKLTKSLNGADFIIENFELPSNYRFHTFTFNLGIPNKRRISIEVYESKGNKLINCAVFQSQNAAPFYANLLFYTDARHVYFNFKLLDSKLDDVYYLYKAQMESEVRLDLSSLESPVFKGELLKLNNYSKNKTNNQKPKTLKELQTSTIFHLIKLFNFDIKNVSTEVFKDVTELANSYLTILEPCIIPVVESQLETLEKAEYNLLLYMINNYHFKVKDVVLASLEVIDELREVYKIHGQNEKELCNFVETSEILHGEKIEIKQNLNEIQETVRDYKVKYGEIVEDLRITLNRQSNLSSKKDAIKRSEYEAEKLEELKDTLLRELCRIRKIKEILKKLDVNTDQEEVEKDFKEKLVEVVEVLYLELGKDVLQIEGKIQDYMEILAYCQGDLEKDELEVEVQNLIESGKNILKEVESLKLEWKKLQDRLEEVGQAQKRLLARFLELKIRNTLLEDLIKYIEDFARKNQE